MYIGYIKVRKQVSSPSSPSPERGIMPMDATSPCPLLKGDELSYALEILRR